MGNEVSIIQQEYVLLTLLMIKKKLVTTYSTRIHQKFRELFDVSPLLVRSPGRVNLIGEHTDYNQGLVLPAAIDKEIVVGISARDDEKIHLYALDEEQTYQGTLQQLSRSELLWPDYIIGIADQALKQGYPIKGFNLVVGGDIPQGAGLSSSAALECATAYGLSKLFDWNITSLQLAKLAQSAENEFVGVKCGLMDQFASVFGKPSQLIQLDCKDFTYQYIPFNAPHLRIVLFDTKVKHSLASSAYNERREQCEKGVALVKAHHPEVESLRDVTEDQLQKFVKPADALVYQRCTFVVAEIKRLLDACEDLKKDDLSNFGKKMFETHDGLQHLYEVSCPELDILVDLVRDEPAVYGARMMGGGFGGCTINLIEADQVDEVVDRVKKGYALKTNTEAAVYIAQISLGTSIITESYD
jgi:galactokinase